MPTHSVLRNTQKNVTMPPIRRLYGCPLPEADESLSSWLIRTAYHYFVAVQKITNYCFGDGVEPYFVIDPDINDLNDIQLKLASKMGEPPNAFTSLVALTRRVLDWPTEIWLVEELGYTSYQSAFCPQCLSSDKVPYFRNRWRYKNIKVCAIHESALLTCCPHCDLPVFPYRYSTTIPVGPRLLEQCPFCRNVLHAAPNKEIPFTREIRSYPIAEDLDATKKFSPHPCAQKKRTKKIIQPISQEQTYKTIIKNAQRIHNLSREKQTAIEIGAEEITRKRQLNMQFLACQRDPTYRLVILQQERDRRRREQIETWTVITIQWAIFKCFSYFPEVLRELDLPRSVARQYNDDATFFPDFIGGLRDELKDKLPLYPTALPMLNACITQCEVYLSTIPHVPARTLALEWHETRHPWRLTDAQCRDTLQQCLTAG